MTLDEKIAELKHDWKHGNGSMDGPRALAIIDELQAENRDIADEVNRLWEDARVDDEDCAQALKTNGELCDNNAELRRDVITKWEPLLAAAKEATAKVPEGGCKIILDDWDLKSLKQLKKAIAACEGKT